ncbi:DUF6544 family protein [Rhodalgimonas zhirmunskyi]|uniref:Uncharacterized protein n=1 Tax=Rhodalgimonas zhirmunskyi TaxID=2964767 RepID=A0AAJ1X4J0_9RHOB|nr:DUF6544 family protein [Rhodoalgimonas zhirmunskyi]MDQ2093561.1 hypothetical protein [Rhodoalgimonas zhirmunskyi]
MKWAVLILAALVVLALVAMGVGLWRTARLADDIRARLDAVEPTTANPPAQVRDWARRMGATGAPARVILTQQAEIEMRPGAGFSPIPARQVIALSAPGFLWQARQPLLGPIPAAQVIDSYAAGQGLLAVRILGAIPVATATGPEIDRAEEMRYLAELPWAPDAALLNPALNWTVTETGFTVSLPSGASVDFELNDAGHMTTMRANGRPATGPDGGFELLDWEGHFSDFTRMDGRLIPKRGEVGYIRDGTYTPYWRGEVTSWQVE